MKIKQYIPISISLSFILSSCFLLFSFISHAQQPATYTQYMNNVVPYNSAYSAVNKNACINLAGRLQWVGIDGAPTSYLLNGSLPIENINASAGIILRQDKIAVENHLNASVFFAKSVQLNNTSSFAASINAGIKSYTANYSQLDPTDPQFRDNISETGATIGAAILLYAPDKYYAGISLSGYNLSNSDQISNRVKSTFYFTGGFLQSLGDSIMLKPAVLVSYAKSIPATADISATVYFKNLGVGVNYRTTNDVAGILSYLISNFRASYSYQAGLGNRNVGSLSSGTHELSFGIFFGRKGSKMQL